MAAAGSFPSLVGATTRQLLGRRRTPSRRPKVTKFVAGWTVVTGGGDAVGASPARSAPYVGSCLGGSRLGRAIYNEVLGTRRSRLGLAPCRICLRAVADVEWTVRRWRPVRQQDTTVEVTV